MGKGTDGKTTTPQPQQGASTQKSLDSKRQVAYSKPVYQQVLGWRLQLKLTQAQLAKELNVSTRTIQRYERGLHRCHPLLADRIAEWLAEQSAAECMARESLQSQPYGLRRTPPPVSGSHKTNLQA